MASFRDHRTITLRVAASKLTEGLNPSHALQVGHPPRLLKVVRNYYSAMICV